MLYENWLEKDSSALDPLMQVSYLASRSLDLDQVLPDTLAAIAELISADQLVVVQLRDDRSVDVRAQWAKPEARGKIQYHQHPCPDLYVGQLHCDANVSAEKTRELFPYLVVSGPICALRVPLIGERVTVGRLDFIREDGKVFTFKERRMAEACARILGPALRNGMEYARVLWLAEHDPLTGIGNRRRFDLALAREIARAQRYGRDLSLLLIDLDDFKEVNTQLGLSGGDEILRRTAHILASGARHGVDISCRIGGDEFAMILPEISEDAAKELAQRLLREVVKVTESLWPVRFSYSISSYPHITAEHLRRIADSRLRDAKNHKQRPVRQAHA